MISRGRSRAPGNLLQLGLETAAKAALDRSSLSTATRDPYHRRQYADDPWGYVRDILGITLSEPQKKALKAVAENDRILIAGANNVGKTLLDACIALWFLDARGALPGGDLEERGARVLLVGPDHNTVFQTVYSEMLSLAVRAEARGFLMPGDRSSRSVLWTVRAKWNVEAFSPPRNAGQNQAHSAAGRHQLEQIAILCEAQGIAEPVWKAAEGMCSTRGNVIIGETNPTECVGSFHARSRLPSWTLVHLSALEHDNITQRRLVIPEAISWQRLEDRIRDQCEPLGAWPDVTPDPAYEDFVYALTPKTEGTRPDEPGDLRSDGIRGSSNGDPMVYRPRGNFAPQSMGRYPKGGEQGLFDPAAVDAAMARWTERHVPEIPADRVGLDSSYGQSDAICAAPSWGADGTSLLLRYQEAMANGAQTAAEDLYDDRIYIGTISVLPAARPPKTAGWMERHYPASHWMIEDAGGGEGVADHAESTLNFHDLSRINPSHIAPERLDEEPVCGNLRAAMYARFAMLVTRGLVDIPDDAYLREELMAMKLEYGAIKTIDGERVQVAHVTSKKDLKKLLGRSPDRADAAALSLLQPESEGWEAEAW